MSIPKQIAFYWAGGPLSWLRYMTLYSFKKHNPEWKMTLYLGTGFTSKLGWKSGESQENRTHEGYDYLKEVTQWDIKVKVWRTTEIINLSPVHQSDLFTWWYLYNYGGFYSDLDILFTHTCASLYDHVQDLDLMFMSQDRSIPIGFLAASPGTQLYHGLYQYCLTQDHETYQSAGYPALCKYLLSAPYIDGQSTIRVLKHRYSECKIGDINYQYTVYPVSWNKAGILFTQKQIPVNKRAIGVHWFGGACLSQEYNRLLTIDNYKQHDCYITREIDKCLKIT